MENIKLELNEVYAIGYRDQRGKSSMRVVTVIEEYDNGIMGWCHTAKNHKKFLYSGVNQFIHIKHDIPITDKRPIGVDTTVYVIFEGNIAAFSIKEITQDADGYVYTISRQGVDVIHIRNPEYLNTTKTACANEWLVSQGLPKLAKGE